MRRYSITDKLLLASLLLSIITIVIVASYSFYNARDAILERTFKQLTTVRVVKTSLLENFMHNRIREIEIVSASSDLTEIVDMLEKHHDSAEAKLVSGHRQLIKSITSKYFSGIYLINNEFGAISLYNKKKTLSDLKKIQGRIESYPINGESPVFFDMITGDSTYSPFIYLISRLKNNINKNPVLLVLEIPISPIDSIMLELDESTGLGVTGESYIVGGDKLMRTSSRFQKNSILTTIVDTKAVFEALSGNSGTEIIEDYRGVKVLSSWGKISIPGLDWIIIAEIDFDEVTIPIYRIRNEIEFISIFIFFIVLVVVFVFSRRITIPIQRLNEATYNLGKGNYDVNIKHKLKDELGDLTDTFNIMVEKLKEQSDELEHERLKSFTSLIDGQESERQRLSRELHDGLGQMLIALKLKFESFIMNDISKKADKRSLTEMTDLFNRTIDETRRMSNNLMPAVLSEFGLVSAARNICNVISDTTDIDVSFISDGFNETLDDRTNIYIYRIIQEALTNVIKHSGADKVIIRLSKSENLISLQIKDNGQGFETEKVDYSTSNGLNNIKNRVFLLKGKFDIESNIGFGTTINVKIIKD